VHPLISTAELSARLGEQYRCSTGCSGPFRERLDQRAINSKKGGGATIETLAMSLQAAANAMDAENDVLFLILTSHGSPAGLAVKAGRSTQTLTPSKLADMLAWTGVRHKVVVISACYSGVFIPRLASPNMLVITAADADHQSFGCRDKAKWTYFGDAFFNVALRQAKSLNDAFIVARVGSSRSANYTSTSSHRIL
jgi:Peptidase C13 family